MNYRQCGLEKRGVRQVSWIPDRFASKGKVVRIKDDDGWKVKEVYGPAVEESIVLAMSRDHLRTRKASDV